MKCLGCYTEVKKGYCVACRKKLFDKAKVPDVLLFDAPKADNLAVFQVHSRRLSISGVQLKYSLRLQNGALTLEDEHGQYILKPVSPAKQLLNIDDAPENEHLTMQIAEQVFGINTAANALIHFRDGQPAYITKRFDVKPDERKFMQEDFAQLTNRTKHTHGETFKYEGSYEEIGLLVKRFVAASAPALEKFSRLIVFNYIISNGDAHLKNFSLIRDDTGEYHLAPAYDLMSTVIHTPHESDTAMNLYSDDINTDFNAAHGYYGRENFMELARRLGIIEKRALRILDHFTTLSEAVIHFIQNSFLSPAAKKIYLSSYIDKLKRVQ